MGSIQTPGVDVGTAPSAPRSILEDALPFSGGRLEYDICARYTSGKTHAPP